MTKKTEDKKAIQENNPQDVERFRSDKMTGVDVLEAFPRSRPGHEIKNPSDMTKEQSDRTDSAATAYLRDGDNADKDDVAFRKMIEDEGVSGNDGLSRAEMEEKYKKFKSFNGKKDVAFKDKPDAAFVDAKSHPETKQESVARDENTDDTKGKRK